MAKESGMAWTTAEVDDSGGVARDLKNDLTNINFDTPKAEFDTTGLDKSAHERILGLVDFSITLNGVFNDAGNASHDVFKTVPSSSVVRTVTLVVSGQTLPNECILTGYALSRGADGSLTYTVPGALADGTVPTWA